MAHDIASVKRKLDRLYKHRDFLEQEAFAEIWSDFLQDFSRTPKSLCEPTKRFADSLCAEATEHNKAIAKKRFEAEQAHRTRSIEALLSRLLKLLEDFPIAIRGEAEAALVATASERALSAKEAQANLSNASWRPYLPDADDAKRQVFSLISRVLDHIEGQLTATGSQNPKDFVPARVILTEHCPDGVVLTDKLLHKFIGYNGGIRTFKPSAQRFSVHLGDWVRNERNLVKWFESGQPRKRSTTLDESNDHHSRDQDPSPAEIKMRRNEIDARKRRK